jgi:hypothetical protein
LPRGSSNWGGYSSAIQIVDEQAKIPATSTPSSRTSAVSNVKRSTAPVAPGLEILDFGISFPFREINTHHSCELRDKNYAQE